ncbi:MAG: lytic transglycosylase domain-containing protein [Hyphomicrobiales bacterium]
MTDWISPSNAAGVAVLSALGLTGPADKALDAVTSASSTSTAWVLHEQRQPDTLPPTGHRLLDPKHKDVEALILSAVQRHGDHEALARLGITKAAFRCWLLALVKQESGFSKTAKSPKKAYGLTQIIPSTARNLGIYPDYYKSPELQVDGGARYLLNQLDKFGSMPLALAAYNAGQGAVKKYGGVPPYKETQGYVASVIAFYNQFARELGGVSTVNTLAAHDLRVSEAATRVAGLQQAESASPENREVTNPEGQFPATVTYVENDLPFQISGPAQAEAPNANGDALDSDPFTAGTKVNLQF